MDDLEEPSASDPLREAALRLAIAEAGYHRALHKVDTHEREPDSAQQLAMKLRQEIWDVLDDMPKKIPDGPPDPHALAYANFAIKQLNSRSCSRRSVTSVACTNATLARRGRSDGKPYGTGVRSTAMKIKIPETNSICNL